MSHLVAFIFVSCVGVASCLLGNSTPDDVINFVFAGGFYLLTHMAIIEGVLFLKIVKESNDPQR